MLQLNNLCYSVTENVDGKTITKQILNNINLNIAKDDFVVITGPNGSGKSTLVKIIMGILKPTSGQIIFNNQDITNLTITQRAKLGIGFAFQNPVRFKGLTVKDLITLSCGSDVDMATLCNYLSDVGLCARDYISREVNDKLSGGELKRIEIAMLEARHAKLSIFDEPEAGIDLWSFNNLINVFKKIQQDNKSANIIISHQERIIEIADKVVVLQAGKVANVGVPQDILSSINAYKSCKKAEV